VNDAEKRNRGKLAFSNGAIMGVKFVKNKMGGASATPIPNSDLDKWFLREELARPTNHGHVFFIHSKVLIIDPLSDDPLVFSGSANFSKNSLTSNDENMLLIRGNTRVADIYMTEMDRLFRHFYARDVINAEAAGGSHKNPLALDTSDDWIKSNFEDGRYKSNRRLLFFPKAGVAVKPWSVAAAANGDPFADEDARVEAARAKKRKQPEDGEGPAPKKKAAKKTLKRKAAKKKAAKKKTAKKAAKKKKKAAPKKKAKTAAKKKKTVKKKAAKKKKAKKKSGSKKKR
jgi:hypothetical protein